MIKPAYIRANSVMRALEVVGDRWVLLLLQQAFFGVRRFDDFQRRLGLARSTLTSRLKHLVEHGLLERRPRDIRRLRHEYCLTAKGKDLFATALMCEQWQRRWAEVPGADGASAMRLIHAGCGQPMEPQLVCGDCAMPIVTRDVRYSDGPGASWVERTARRRRRSVADGPLPTSVPMSPDLLELLGDRWTPQVAAVAFFGVRRFEDMRSTLQLATNILSDRLKRLVALGIFSTHVYQARPRRLEYRLTGKGVALYPVLIALMDWGDRWYASESGPPLLLTHLPCGAGLKAHVVCDRCGGTLTPENVQPGFESLRRFGAVGRTA